MLGHFATINQLVRECDTYSIFKAAPHAYPQAPILPIARFAAEEPLAACRVDNSKPHFVKEGRARKKIWIALFTCMVSCAIHIETVPDLSAETFLQAPQAMAWEKGTPKALLSDNAFWQTFQNQYLHTITFTNINKQENSLSHATKQSAHFLYSFTFFPSIYFLSGNPAPKVGDLVRVYS